MTKKEMIFRIAELTEQAYREMKRKDSLYGLTSPQSQEATARWFALDNMCVEFGIDTVEVLNQKPDSEIAKTMTVIDSVDYSEEVDLEEYSPSAECRDYSPSAPWNVPRDIVEACFRTACHIKSSLEHIKDESEVGA